MKSSKEALSQGARRRHRTRIKYALLFLFPGLVLYSVLILFPTVQSLIYSLQDWKGMTGRFIGIANFVELIHDKYVWVGLTNNLRVLAVAVFFSLPLSFTLAYMLSKKPKVASTYRFLYFIPGLVGVATMALLWGFIYEAKYGVLNSVLHGIGLPGLIQPWLSKNGVVQWSVIAPDAYGGIGFFVIIYMAAISEIPDSLYEAAAIDGANSWHQLIHITLPSVWGVYLMTNVLAVLGALSSFAFPFILTQGGPLHRTETLTSYAVWQSFRNYRRGYGAAIAVFHFAVAIVATLLIRRLARPEHKESKAL